MTLKETFRSIPRNQRLMLGGIAVIVFVVGFLAGREQVKYQIRSAMQDAFGAFGDIAGGNEAVTKYDENEAEDEPIQISLKDKGFIKADFMNSVYQDQITFTIDLTNTLEKEVRAFTGQLHFYDLFDREILALNFTHEDPIAAGETLSWEGVMDYNQFMDNHQSLANAELENVTVSLHVEDIIYADGSREEF